NNGPEINAGNGSQVCGSRGNPFCIGGNESGGEIASAWTVVAVFLWQGDRIPSPARLREFSKNYWSMWQAPRTAQSALLAALSAPASATGAVLAAAAYTPTMSGAALSTAINLATSSASSSKAGAALSTAVAIGA